MGIILLVVLLFPYSAFAVPTISGQVKNANTGFGIAGIDLDVFDYATGSAVTITGGTTNATGNYTVTLSGPGSYIIRADPNQTDGFIDEFYNEVYLKSQATPLALGDTTALTGINFTLSIGYNISGRVYYGVSGLDAIDIDVYASNGEFLSGVPGTTSGGGYYTVGAVPAGTYYLRAEPAPSLGQYYVVTFYGGGPDIAGASPIVVTNTSVGNININLTPGGAIGGKVTAKSNNAPLEGIDLDLFDSNRNYMNVTATTAADGAYLIGAVAPGNYRLRVDPTVSQGYPRLYYINALNFSLAQDILVTAGTTTPGINFSLPSAGTISGVIRSSATTNPIANIDLDCYDLMGNRVDITALSGADGTYRIGPLPPGSYVLRADPNHTQGYLLQYYNHKTDGLTADTIIVASGADTGSINFDLADAGWVQGTVWGPGAIPLPDIDLDVYDAATDQRQTLGGKTAADGAYIVGPLAPGGYKLRCDPTITQGFAVEYWNSKVRLANADPINVAAAKGTMSINFNLDLGGSLSGTITSLLTSLPIQGIDLDVFGSSSGIRLDQSAKTDAAGYYELGPLPPGTYILLADVPAGLLFAHLYYLNSRSAVGASVLTVNAGTQLPHIDLSLPSVAAASVGWMLY